MTSLKNTAPPPLKASNILDTNTGLYCSTCVCYHHKDHKFTKRVIEFLKQTDRNVWWDNREEGMPATSEWQDEVHKAIEFSDSFIFVLSPDSINDEALKLHLKHAVKNGKRTITVKYKEIIEHKDLPTELRMADWIDFNPIGPSAAKLTHEEKFATAMKLLFVQLDEDHRHAQYHTIILRRAIEWERHDFEKSLLLRDKDLTRAQHWLSASALGKAPKPTTLHLSFITASSALDSNMKKRKLIAIFFGVIVAIGIIWPSWGVFFFSLVFSHFFVYFSSNS